jgi:NADH:ubiquinone oxidoreductase subunit D
VVSVAIHVRPGRRHRWLRALQSELRRIFHDCLNLLLEVFDVGLGQMSRLDHVRRQLADSVRSNFGQLGLRWIAELDLSDRR